MQETFSGPGLKLVDSDEYSESGRGVYPDGLYRMLLQFHERYKHLKLPFIISENGVSDETDLIRGPYLLEHLLAVYAAITRVFIRIRNLSPFFFGNERFSCIGKIILWRNVRMLRFSGRPYTWLYVLDNLR